MAAAEDGQYLSVLLNFFLCPGPSEDHVRASCLAGPPGLAGLRK